MGGSPSRPASEEFPVEIGLVAIPIIILLVAALCLVRARPRRRRDDDYDEAVRRRLATVLGGVQKPRDAEYHNGRGLAYLEAGQPERAVEEFDRAVRLQPGLAAAYG